MIFGNGQDDLNDSGQQAKPDQTAKNKDKATGESKYQKGVMNNYITVSNEYACYYNAIYVSFFLSCKGGVVYGVKCEVTHKYVWNQHLLDDVKDVLHPDWLLYIIHGFIGQSSMFHSNNKQKIFQLL